MYRKRSRSFAYKNQPYKKPRVTAPASALPLNRSALIPLSRRGYRFNRIEKKAIDVAVAGTNVNTSGVFTILNACIQGTDFDERVGRKIIVKSVQIRGRIQTEPSLAGTATVATGSQQCRMILFVDMQPNGAAPAVTDLLTNATPQAMLNLNNRDRFRILRDKVFVLDPYLRVDTATQSIASMTNQVKNVKVFKRCNIETIYNSGNAGTVADITSGAIHCLWLGNLAAGTNTDSNFFGEYRVRFSDP